MSEPCHGTLQNEGNPVTSKICVVIPAYNASESIAWVVTGALRHMPAVMVADDGSTDQTAKCALDAGADVVVIEKNRGKGHALKVLFRRAGEKGYDAVISMDADGQHDPEEIPAFVDAHERHPHAIIVGSRMGEKKNIPRARYNSMHIARFYVSLAANRFIEDTQCGFRLYPLFLFTEIDVMTDGYVTETEILMKAGDIGTDVRFIGIRAIYDGTPSHFRPVLDMTAITAYVISYITVKWTIEAVSSNKPNTYSRGGFRDFISSHKKTDILFQTITALTTLPFSVLCLIEYVLLPLIVKNNFASIRGLGVGFHRITVATHMLPVTLVVATMERMLKAVGLNIVLVDRFLEKSFPDFWGDRPQRGG
jgi:glycosyltransferase involved in cell wall biosynthesis